MQGSTAVEGLVYTHYTQAATGNSTIAGSLYVVNADSEPMSTGNLTITYNPSLALEYGSIEGLNLQGALLSWEEI